MKYILKDLRGMKKKIKKVYIGGALTNSHQKEIYEKVGEICQSIAREVYTPHLRGTDPVKDSDVTPEVVWQVDEHEVSSADLVVAYVGRPSLGVGGELEIARMAKTDIILWWFKGEEVSRLPRGNPAVIEQIEAKDEEDLYNKLKNILKHYAK